jgi:GTP-binding protein HflX
MHHRKGEPAILVHIHFSADRIREDLEEFQELAQSAGACILAVITGSRQAPDPKYFIGTGKADEIRQQVAHHQVQLVLINHNLSPTQERNLEKLFQCRVLDRTGLILDIFAQRARSFEGKLQVELALLNHMATRLVRGWTHLERQRGGIGLRGPGETQLEVDRRLIRNRIKTIHKRLEKVRQQREQSRRARSKAVVPTIALVGYTNVGKSTLFNLLTGADVYSANQLFATLDPTLRRAFLAEGCSVILADTVGFIRHLPHSLVEAFRATLEEVTKADLLLHVIDTHDPLRDTHIAQVNAVLAEIEAADVPQILVYNKIDLCPEILPHLDAALEEHPPCAWISAEKKRGIEELKGLIRDRFRQPAL